MENLDLERENDWEEGSRKDEDGDEDEGEDEGEDVVSGFRVSQCPLASSPMSQGAPCAN